MPYASWGRFWRVVLARHLLSIHLNIFTHLSIFTSIGREKEREIEGQVASGVFDSVKPSASVPGVLGGVSRDHARQSRLCFHTLPHTRHPSSDTRLFHTHIDTTPRFCLLFLPVCPPTPLYTLLLHRLLPISHRASFRRQTIPRPQSSAELGAYHQGLLLCLQPPRPLLHQPLRPPPRRPHCQASMTEQSDDWRSFRRCLGYRLL